MRTRPSPVVICWFIVLLVSLEIEQSNAIRWGRKRSHQQGGDTASSQAAQPQETCDVPPVNPFDNFEYSFPHQQQKSRNKVMELISQYYHELPDSLQLFAKRLYGVVMYEPPVGIVALFMAVRLIWTGRIFSVYQNKYKSVDGVLTQEEKRSKRRTRLKIPLDTDDASYVKFGGVERIRRQLCWTALNGVLQEGDASPQVVAAVDALSVSYKPRETRYMFVDEMIEPLSRLEAILIEDDSKIKSSSELRDMWEKPKSDMDVILQLSAKTAEIRALDALLRVSRDQLITTSSRLYRNFRHWKRRVSIDNNISWLFYKIMKASIEGDRMRLAYAKASFESEVSRLGSIAKILMRRPSDMDDKALLDAIAKSSKVNKTASEEQKPRRKIWGRDFFRRAIPRVSKYSLRFNAEGRGRITLRVYDGETTIRSDVAWNELLENGEVDPREWIEEAHDWTEEARTILCDVLRESVETSISNNDAKRDLAVIDQWCTYECGNCDDLDKQWKAIRKYLCVTMNRFVVPPSHRALRCSESRG